MGESGSEYLFLIGSDRAVNRAFDKYASRCEATLSAVFERSDSDALDFKHWLYQFAEDREKKLSLLHNEPLYTSAEYMGLEKSDLKGSDYEKKYTILADERQWHDWKP